MIHSEHKPYGPYEKYFKRLFDFIFSLLAIIILSPVMLITAITVRIKLGSPVLFTQERPGKYEKTFKLFKFRSMKDICDDNGKQLSDDERLTSFGRKLRSTSLDELPELFNIIRGDMSFVGPRPLLVEYLPWYSDEESHRHDVRPGLTGLAQVNGRNFLGWDKRLAMDVEYVNKITFVNDISIIWKTVWKALKKEDIAVDTQAVESNFAKERQSLAIAVNGE